MNYYVAFRPLWSMRPLLLSHNIITLMTVAAPTIYTCRSSSSLPYRSSVWAIFKNSQINQSVSLTISFSFLLTVFNLWNSHHWVELKFIKNKNEQTLTKEPKILLLMNNVNPQGKHKTGRRSILLNTTNNEGPPFHKLMLYTQHTLVVENRNSLHKKSYIDECNE